MIKILTSPYILVLAALLLWSAISPDPVALSIRHARIQWRQHRTDTIQLPKIPNRSTLVSLRHPDMDQRPYIQAAIDSLHALGGGEVRFQSGLYYTMGPIHLRSGIALNLPAGCILKFSDDAKYYLPVVKVRWEGSVCWNYSPLIYAFNAQDIAITGQGIIDGNGQNWSVEWRKIQKPDQSRLRQMGAEGVDENHRIFGNGFLDRNGDGRDDGHGDGQLHYLRPSLIEFYECRRILISGVQLKNSPFWTVHPVFSRHIVMRNLTIQGSYLNDDGIDPDSCEDVLIEGCNIATHDDAISIKAGRDQDAWNRPGSRRITVRNCTLRSEKANAFCIGSELSGGVSEVFVEGCHIRYARYGINFKTNLDRGGAVERIYMRNISMDTCSESMLFFQTNYHSYRGGQFPTRFQNIYLQAVHAQQTDSASIRFDGLPDAPIRQVLLHRVGVRRSGQPPVFKHTESIWLRPALSR